MLLSNEIKNRINPTVTVFTSTYNRAHTLHRCYESLKRQTSQDYEWLIIDDGSTDNTKQLVEGWIAEGSLNMQYFFKKNGGVHTGYNLAYRKATGDLVVCIDSDDYLADDAIETIISFWRKNGSEKYAGIIGLDSVENGSIIGTNFKTKSTRISEYYAKGGRGDKKLVFRREVVNQFAEYPEIEGEKMVPASYKTLLIDQIYETLTLNKVLCIVEYQQDGLTAVSQKKNILKRDMIGNSIYFNVALRYEFTFRGRFRAAAFYIVCNMYKSNKRVLAEANNKWLVLLAIAPALVLWGKYKLKYRK